MLCFVYNQFDKLKSTKDFILLDSKLIKLLMQNKAIIKSCSHCNTIVEHIIIYCAILIISSPKIISDLINCFIMTINDVVDSYCM